MSQAEQEETQQAVSTNVTTIYGFDPSEEVVMCLENAQQGSFQQAKPSSAASITTTAPGGRAEGDALQNAPSAAAAEDEDEAPEEDKVEQEEEPPKKKFKSNNPNKSHPNDASWDASYQKLLAYKAEHGHTNVPNRYKPDRALGRWVGFQRSLKSHDNLREDREERLNIIGFRWAPAASNNPNFGVPNEAVWDASYAKLLAFKQLHGHCIVPNRYAADKSLGQWVSSQRQLSRLGTLRDDRKERLNQIGFCWAPPTGGAAYSSEHHGATDDAKWMEHLAAFKQYKERHGTELVPTNKNGQLGSWIIRQRRKSKDGSLRADRKKLLVEAGFVFEARQHSQNRQWKDMYLQLAAYRDKHHTTMVPAAASEDNNNNEESEDDNNKQLSLWVQQQQLQYKKGQLRQDRKELLNKLGFVWSPAAVRDARKAAQEEKIWQDFYAKLQAYKTAHGDTLVSSEADKALATWVRNQRKFNKNGTLREDRKEDLNQIGMVWTNSDDDDDDYALMDQSSETRWMKHYERLKTFSQKHGHLLVPIVYDGDRTLNAFCYKQRVDYQNHDLRPHRKQLLDQIGLAWTDCKNVHEKQWLQQFEKIKAYKAAHDGDTAVPYDYEEDKPLGRWTSLQRKNYKAKTLRADRQELLEGIGFVFQPPKVVAGQKKRKAAEILASLSSSHGGDADAEDETS